MPNVVGQSWNRMITATLQPSEFGPGAVNFVAWALEAGSEIEIAGFDGWIDVGSGNVDPANQIQVSLIDGTLLQPDSQQLGDLLFMLKNSVFWIREIFAGQFARIHDTAMNPLRLSGNRRYSLAVRYGAAGLPLVQTVDVGITVYGGIVDDPLRAPRLRRIG